jgi:hypothetical protein
MAMAFFEDLAGNLGRKHLIEGRVAVLIRAWQAAGRGPNELADNGWDLRQDPLTEGRGFLKSPRKGRIRSVHCGAIGIARDHLLRSCPEFGHQFKGVKTKVYKTFNKQRDTRPARIIYARAQRSTGSRDR